MAGEDKEKVEAAAKAEAATGAKPRRRLRLRRRTRPILSWAPPLIRDEFPDPREADADGLVGLGGNFSPEMLLKAYAKGIFPWPSEEIDLIWFSPDPRMLLRPNEVHKSRNLRRKLRRGELKVTFDQAFDQVIEACGRVQGRDKGGTWIVTELQQSFRDLHRQGLAHSVEVWREDKLVGGLYGLSLGAMFCGESMFHLEDEASRIAFVALAEKLAEWDFLFLDCQVHSEHLARLGAREWPREDFLAELARALELPTRRGRWSQAIDTECHVDGIGGT